MNSLIVHTVPRLAKDYTDFKNTYDDLIMITLCPNVKSKHINQQGRVCRFCRRMYPKTNFRKDAHTIPNFLGNRYLVSEDECDECNEKFSRYENDFKNYLGIIPTLTKTIGKSNTYPKFKSPKNEIVASRSSKLALQDSSIEVFKESLDSNALNFDFERGEAKGRHTKYPYIPYNVYKALLKIGLSCLPIQYFIDYKNAVAVLQNEFLIPKSLSYVHKTSFPLDGVKFPVPYVLIFSKKIHNYNCPSHLVMLYYQNLIFQYYLPYHVRDRHIYTTEKATFQYAPPLFNSAVDDSVQFETQLLDLSFAGRRTNEIQEFRFNIDYDKNKPFVRFNKQTGEHEVYEHTYPKDIVGFAIVPRGTILKKEDFI